MKKGGRGLDESYCLRHLFAALGIVILTCGCSGFSERLDSDEAVVYVLNTVPRNSGESHIVFVNGKRIAFLKSGQYTRFRIAPGSYSLTVTGTSRIGRRLTLAEIVVESNDVRYFVYDETIREDYLIEYGSEHARQWLLGKRLVYPRYSKVEALE